MDPDALGRLERAKEALKDNPDDWTLLDEKLQALLDLRRYRDALEATARMVELWPDGAGSHYNHGYVLAELHKFEQAVASYKKAVALKPDFVAAYIEMANAYWDLQELESAEDALKRALSIEPDNSRALDRLAPVLGQREKYQEAIALCRRIIDQNPSNARAHVNLGVALQSSGDLYGASQAYAKAEELDPERATIFYNSGRLLFELGETEQALEKFKKAAELDPQDPDAVAYLARIYSTSGETEKERQALNEYQKRAPTSAWGYRGLCVLALDEGDFESVERYARFGLEHEPDNHVLLHCLGMALTSRGAYKEAVGVFNKAISSDPEDLGTRFELAYALAGLGKIRAARKELERVATEADDPELAQAARNRLEELAGEEGNE